MDTGATLGFSKSAQDLEPDGEDTEYEVGTGAALTGRDCEDDGLLTEEVDATFGFL